MLPRLNGLSNTVVNTPSVIVVTRRFTDITGQKHLECYTLRTFPSLLFIYLWFIYRLCENPRTHARTQHKKLETIAVLTYSRECKRE